MRGGTAQWSKVLKGRGTVPLHVPQYSSTLSTPGPWVRATFRSHSLASVSDAHERMNESSGEKWMLTISALCICVRCALHSTLYAASYAARLHRTLHVALYVAHCTVRRTLHCTLHTALYVAHCIVRCTLPALYVAHCIVRCTLRASRWL